MLLSGFGNYENLKIVKEKTTLLYEWRSN